MGSERIMLDSCIAEVLVRNVLVFVKACYKTARKKKNCARFLHLAYVPPLDEYVCLSKYRRLRTSSYFQAPKDSEHARFNFRRLFPIYFCHARK